MKSPVTYRRKILLERLRSQVPEGTFFMKSPVTYRRKILLERLRNSGTSLKLT